MGENAIISNRPAESEGVIKGMITINGHFMDVKTIFWREKYESSNYRFNYCNSHHDFNDR